MDECAGLVGQKAHDAAHDGRRIGQGKAAELRGGHVGLLAAGAAAHHGGQAVIGLRCGLGGLGRGLGSRFACLLGNKRRSRGIELHRCVRAGGRGDLAGMHHDDAAGARLNKLDHLGIGEAGHVVNDRGAAAHGRLGNRHMTRVNRDDGALLGQRAHHGQHAASLLVGVDRGKTRARGLAAHVDDVGAGVEHR